MIYHKPTDELPKRKNIRLSNRDYSKTGAYFVTICIKGRENILRKSVGADIIRPSQSQLHTLNHLSDYGKTVNNGINDIHIHYKNVSVSKYCIMPDHLHLIVIIKS